MNYLIQIRGPVGVGWDDFLVKQGCGVRLVMKLVAEHYRGDQIHDVRIKRLKTHNQLQRAIKNVQHNWEKYGHQGRRAGRDTLGEHGCGGR